LRTFEDYTSDPTIMGVRSSNTYHMREREREFWGFGK